MGLPKQTKQSFISKTKGTSAGCIEWTAALDKYGYGVVMYHNKQWKAHRLAWFLFNEQDPKAMWVLHTCHNRACVNVEHLYLGTALENNRDTVLAGRYRNSFSRRAHCKNGHSFSGTNLYVEPSGKRVCKTCRRAVDKKRYRKHKGWN